MSETPKSKKKKIDHVIAKVEIDKCGTDWETSRLGYGAKDVSDAVVASVDLASRYGTKTATALFKEDDDTSKGITLSDMMVQIKKMHGL